MKRVIINTVAGIVFVISLYILVFQGFGFPNITPLLNVVLRLLTALCVQILAVCNFKVVWIRVLPLITTAVIALWGGSLFLTSDVWKNVTFGTYAADYVSPFLGCCVAWLICRGICTKE